MSSSFDDSTVFVASKQLVAGKLPDELILLHEKQGLYFGLNEVGALIWKRLAEPTAVSDLISAVVAEYEVTEDRCREDVHGLLNQMLEQGIVEVSS